MERMTSNGRRWAFVFGVLIAFALPKHADRGTVLHGKTSCTRSVVEPWGCYLLEAVLGRDLGVAYSHEQTCD